MTDQTEPVFKMSTNVTDPELVHAEVDKHKEKAVAHFGGHVHFVRSNQSAVPTHDDEGKHTGHIIVVTSVWKQAPPEQPIPTDGSAEAAAAARAAELNAPSGGLPAPTASNEPQA